ncbi:MAG TPA: S66 peptidase family protein [Candidatus Saccharimonadales bacterium]|nr:S66 peptidase family protein [Candidatus Saccharimonadales bacterium]
MPTAFYPPPLQRGDTIGVIATSSPLPTNYDSIIQRGYDYLRNKGFTVIEHEQCRKSKNGYLAGSIEDRVHAIHEFLKNPSVKCIMSFWGGANTNQILDNLDYSLVVQHPKIFIGYSDTTALLQAITTKTGLVTYLGPAVISFAKNPSFNYTWQFFEKMCISPAKETLYVPSQEYSSETYLMSNDGKNRKVENNEGLQIFRDGQAKGRIVAGHLQTLLELYGTEYFPDLENAILFLEEAEDFQVPMIHRFFTQAKQIGVFNKIAGLVLGRFPIASQVDKLQLYDILDEILYERSIPVIYNTDFGHTDPLITIPNGGMCELDTKKALLKFVLE